jgi:hypothetical protein
LLILGTLAGATAAPHPPGPRRQAGVMARVEELIFTALCDRFRSPTQIWQSMSLVELEEATGLAKAGY